MFRRWWRDTNSQPPELPSEVSKPIEPSPVTFYSTYLKRRPQERLQDSIGNFLPVTMLAHMRPSALPEGVRGRLALAMERNRAVLAVDDTLQGRVISAGSDVMGQVALQLLVAHWGDLSLRDSGYPRRSHLNRLAAIVLTEEDVPRVLDVLGAWTQAYASIPDIPWAAEFEQRFLADVGEALRETDFAVRGRDIVLRSDLAGAVIIDAPFRALVATEPGLRSIDEKLQEALAELDSGRTGDAVTDAGTAMQMLLGHLGFPGATLGDQLKSARRSQLFSGVDTKLGAALESLTLWIAATRNERGDAHPGPAPDKRDAEFVVRLVALLVMRFAS